MDGRTFHLKKHLHDYLHDSWKQQTKVLILLIWFLIVCITNGEAQDTDETPIKVNTLLLNVPVIVSDRNGRNIVGLKKEDFSIFQGGEKQTIEFFADTESPMNVAILIDTSMSTREVLGAIKKSAKTFLTTFGSEDKGIIVGFDYEVKILNKLTSNQNRLRNGIDSAVTTDIPIQDAPQGASAMYDAMYRVITKDFAEVKGRKAVIILTDGFEAGTKISVEKISDTLIESDTLVYPIIFQTRGTGSYFPSNTKSITMQQLINLPLIDSLNKMTVSTGGRIYAAEGSDFSSAFQTIAEELRKQYVIGFYPTGPDGGKSTGIKIDVNKKDVIVRSKRTIRLKPRVPTAEKSFH